MNQKVYSVEMGTQLQMQDAEIKSYAQLQI